MIFDLLNLLLLARFARRPFLLSTSMADALFVSGLARTTSVHKILYFHIIRASWPHCVYAVQSDSRTQIQNSNEEMWKGKPSKLGWPMLRTDNVKNRALHLANYIIRMLYRTTQQCILITPFLCLRIIIAKTRTIWMRCRIQQTETDQQGGADNVCYDRYIVMENTIQTLKTKIQQINWDENNLSYCFCQELGLSTLNRKLNILRH